MNPDTAKIGSVAFEANRAYCETLGDYSQPSWIASALWQKESVIDGVQAIIDGSITNPEQSHKNWIRLKEEEGWVWGEAKDVERKIHPCMLPFADLPVYQQTKDHLFFAIVTTLLENNAKIT